MAIEEGITRRPIDLDGYRERRDLEVDRAFKASWDFIGNFAVNHTSSDATQNGATTQ